MDKSALMGTEKIGKLIIQQSVPASIGMMVMTIYMIVDTIFVGQWVGPIAIAAISVVMPISFLISSTGMAIGIGGSSIISRALGNNNKEKVVQTYTNQLILTLSIAIFFVLFGLLFSTEILLLFGGKGNILIPAKEYFDILLIGVPFLALAMTGNNVIRSLGFPKVAMYVMLIPAITNLILDPIFIYTLDFGIKGAAWATVISYILSGAYATYFILFKNKEISLSKMVFKLDLSIVKEIFSLGSVSLARQGVVSLLALILNNILFNYGNELYVSLYGIVNRVMMFSLFPVIGITQGFLPILGYNYGANHIDRVKETIYKSILYGTIISIIIYVLIIVFKKEIVLLFTDDQFLLDETPSVLLIVFFAMPLILVQLIGSAYYQAIGKAFPALLLTLTKQGFFLIPLILILPNYYGIQGVWYAFPIADFLSIIVTLFFLIFAIKSLNKKKTPLKNNVSLNY